VPAPSAIRTRGQFTPTGRVVHAANAHSQGCVNPFAQHFEETVEAIHARGQLGQQRVHDLSRDLPDEHRRPTQKPIQRCMVGGVFGLVGGIGGRFLGEMSVFVLARTPVRGSVVGTQRQRPTPTSTSA